MYHCTEAAEPPSKRARHGVPGASSSNGGKLWSVDTKWEAEVLGKVRDGGVSEATIVRRLEAGLYKLNPVEPIAWNRLVSFINPRSYHVKTRFQAFACATRDLGRYIPEHVERIDSEQALEYSMQNKEGLSEPVHLMPVGAAHDFAPIAHHPTCAFRLLRGNAFGKFAPGQQ